MEGLILLCVTAVFVGIPIAMGVKLITDMRREARGYTHLAKTLRRMKDDGQMTPDLARTARHIILGSDDKK